MKLAKDYVTLHDKTECLHFQAVKHEGVWMSRDEWLEVTYNNTLPLHEPLKTLIKEKIDNGTLEE